MALITGSLLADENSLIIYSFVNGRVAADAFIGPGALPFIDGLNLGLDVLKWMRYIKDNFNPTESPTPYHKLETEYESNTGSVTIEINGVSQMLICENGNLTFESRLAFDFTWAEFIVFQNAFIDFERICLEREIP